MMTLSGKLVGNENASGVQANEKIQGDPNWRDNGNLPKSSSDTCADELSGCDLDMMNEDDGDVNNRFSENRIDGGVGSRINLKPESQDATFEEEKTTQQSNLDSLFVVKQMPLDDGENLSQKKMQDSRGNDTTTIAVKAEASIDNAMDLVQNDNDVAALTMKGNSQPQNGNAKTVISIDVDEEIPDGDKKPAAKENLSRSPTPLSTTTQDMKKLSLDDVPTAKRKRNNYPLDGKWEMVWKLHPKNTTTFEVSNHTFHMLGCPCEIIWSESPYGTCHASFQWPALVSENPVYQESKGDIPTDATSIEWSTSNPQYGDITWNRLDSDGCKLQPEEKKRSCNEASKYPLDGNWVLTWKSYYLEPALVIVHKHTFELFDYHCNIKFKPEDGFCPSFHWPTEVFSSETPIIQKGKEPLPKNLEELPSTIEWTISDKQYGEAIWTKLSENDSIAPHIIDRKRKAICDAEIEKRRKEEEKRMKSSIPGKAWDLVKGLIVLAKEIEEISTIAEDDVIFLAERLLKAQKDFKGRGLPYTVDIAYHHTQSINLATIKTDGLLSRVEREEKGINSKFNGSSYGEGIYCSGDPIQYANQRYGDTTIMLARMKGTKSWNRVNECNTTIHSGFCVLKRCNQCIPLFQFESKYLGTAYDTYSQYDSPSQPGKPQFQQFRDKLVVFQRSVQRLLDQIINENIESQANPTWHDRYRFPRPGAQSRLSIASPSGPSPAAIKFMKEMAKKRAERAKEAQRKQLKDIRNWNSTADLSKVILTSNFPQLVEAAKMRLMTISPHDYSALMRNQLTPPALIQNNFQVPNIDPISAQIASALSGNQQAQASNLTIGQANKLLQIFGQQNTSFPPAQIASGQSGNQQAQASNLTIGQTNKHLQLTGQQNTSFLLPTPFAPGYFAASHTICTWTERPSLE